jgi:hypothetical protein
MKIYRQILKKKHIKILIIGLALIAVFSYRTDITFFLTDVINRGVVHITGESWNTRGKEIIWQSAERLKLCSDIFKTKSGKNSNI